MRGVFGQFCPLSLLSQRALRSARDHSMVMPDSGGGEPRLEQVANGLAALHRRFGDLMVDGVFGVERRECVDIGVVACALASASFALSLLLPQAQALKAGHDFLDEIG